jgi:hypothetical protein
MDDQPKAPKPTSRQAKLAAALRDNLKRRKAQAKRRREQSGTAGGAAHDSAGIGEDK